MKNNKLTLALAALGVISMASAQANTTVYLTGSTAARAFIYAAATTPGQIFTGASTVVGFVGTSASSGDNQIVYEGNITGVTGLVDLDCSFTGSEAGIAAVAGQTLQQSLTSGVYGYASGNFALPGVPPSFLNPNATPAFSGSAVPLSQITSAPSVPDLTMADTSQAVSLTPKTSFNLKDYGAVAVVPFTWMRGYSATPYTTSSPLANITTSQANQLIGGEQPASFLTGNVADSSLQIATVGRNKGSGTRVNMKLNAASSAVTASVDQFAFGAYYAAGGVLTFTNVYTPNQTLVEIGNDGFDSGGSVQKVLNVDGTGAVDPNASQVILIGYLGMSDAAAAAWHGSTTGAGAATYLQYNGVYESDAAVENGSYTYWGTEHLLGTVGQNPTLVPGLTAAAIKRGIAAQLTSAGAGNATGAVGPTYTAQSVLIPTTSMQVGRGGLDYGFPTVGSF